MVYFNKTVANIDEIIPTLEKSCDMVWKNLKQTLEGKTFESYDEWVAWALQTCSENIPSPFSMEFPNCYGLTLGSSYFTLHFPNNFGIGIKAVPGKEGYKYSVDVVFRKEESQIKDSVVYKSLISNGWKIKHPKN